MKTNMKIKDIIDHRFDLGSNVESSHPAGPGSIPVRINFLFQIITGVFPQL